MSRNPTIGPPPRQRLAGRRGGGNEDCGWPWKVSAGSASRSGSERTRGQSKLARLAVRLPTRICRRRVVALSQEGRLHGHTGWRRRIILPDLDFSPPRSPSHHATASTKVKTALGAVRPLGYGDRLWRTTNVAKAAPRRAPDAFIMP